MKRDEENVEQVFGFDRPLTLPLPFDHSCQALGTHAGMIFILDVEGNLVKGFRSHSASILTLEIDSSSEFVASAGMDGKSLPLSLPFSCLSSDMLLTFVPALLCALLRIGLDISSLDV